MSYQDGYDHGGGVPPAAPPREMRAGDYAKRMANTSDSEKAIARTIMRGQGCKSIRFQANGDGSMTAHGYVGRFEGAEMEQL